MALEVPLVRFFAGIKKVFESQWQKRRIFMKKGVITAFAAAAGAGLAGKNAIEKALAKNL